MLSDGFVFKLEVFQIGDVHVLNEGHGVGGVVFLLDAGEEFLGVGSARRLRLLAMLPTSGA